MNELSFVYFLQPSPTNCEYCKKRNEDKTWSYTKKWVFVSATVIQMTVHDYEELLLRGWLRNGSYMYQPLNDQCCCPQYAYRVHVPEYDPPKHHKKVLSKMNSFLDGIKHIKDVNIEKKQEDRHESIENDLKKCCDEFLQEENQKDVNYKCNLSTKHVKGSGDVHSNVAIQIAIKTQLDAKKVANGIVNRFQSIYLKNHPNVSNISCSDLGHINFYFQKSHQQIPSKTKHLEYQSPHELDIKFVPSEFIQEEFEIFQKYQVKVHGDVLENIKAENFKANFCDNPIMYDTNSEIGLPHGSYHMQYILDGKIIAVSVVDVLPSGLNCMYHFYDTDYSFLSFGTYSAIYEIQWVQEMNMYSNKFEFYYLGSYVHDCSKVNYKKQYQPGQLLDSVTNTFVPFGQAVKVLEKQSFGKFNLDVDPVDSEIKESDLIQILIYNDKKVTRFGVFEKKVTQVGMDKLKMFVKALGRKLAMKVIFYLDPKDVEGYQEPIVEQVVTTQGQGDKNENSENKPSPKEEEEEEAIKSE